MKAWGQGLGLGPGTSEAWAWGSRVMKAWVLGLGLGPGTSMKQSEAQRHNWGAAAGRCCLLPDEAMPRRARCAGPGLGVAACSACLQRLPAAPAAPPAARPLPCPTPTNLGCPLPSPSPLHSPSPAPTPTPDPGPHPTPPLLQVLPTGPRRQPGPAVAQAGGGTGACGGDAGHGGLAPLAGSRRGGAAVQLGLEPLRPAGEHACLPPAWVSVCMRRVLRLLPPRLVGLWLCLYLPAGDLPAGGRTARLLAEPGGVVAADAGTAAPLWLPVYVRTPT